MNIEVKNVEKSFYLRAMKMAKNSTEAAKILGISRSQFFKKVKSLGIKWKKRHVVIYEVKL